MAEVVSRAATFDDRIRTREAKVGIVGLGYAGLPLAMAFAEAGFEVTGIDVSEDRVRAVQERRSYLVDVPAERYAGLDGRLRATTDYATVADLDALTICVPTPLSKTRTPDLSYIVAAAESVAENLRPGQLVVLQSTTYPGTTEEIVAPLLQEGSGLQPGRDFALGYSPERIDPGNAIWTFTNTPKIISGVDHASLERVRDFYDDLVTRTVAVPSPREAELAKLLENTFRHVNIALVNELAMLGPDLGIDIWEAIEAASTKPF
ncbi:MAG: nucleotide sugar dehydrogenase, partial [Actinomycetota bacterium]|nr:nucleotide sugar dehydrogenase [Actinomycetota bacterium]